MSEGAASDEFEYRTETCTLGDEGKLATKLGKDGWELVSSTPEKFWRRSVNTFKRPRVRTAREMRRAERAEQSKLATDDLILRFLNRRKK